MFTIAKIYSLGVNWMDIFSTCICLNIKKNKNLRGYIMTLPNIALLKVKVFQKDLETYQGIKPGMDITSDLAKKVTNASSVAKKVAMLALVAIPMVLAAVADLVKHSVKLTAGNFFAFFKNAKITHDNKKALTYKAAEQVKTHQKVIVLGGAALAVVGLATTGFIYRANVLSALNWSLISVGLRQAPVPAPKASWFCFGGKSC